jgi:hypothetical protein
MLPAAEKPIRRIKAVRVRALAAFLFLGSHPWAAV